MINIGSLGWSVVGWSALAATLGAVSACSGSGDGSAPVTEEASGTIQAALTQIPSGVLCVQVTVSRSGQTTTFDVTTGQSSASLSIGPLLAGTTTVSAAAYDLACGSVLSSTVPDWVGAPVSVDVKPGMSPQVNLTLLPNVATKVGVSFVNPAVDLAIGNYTSYAIGSSSDVRAWGDNTYGQFGDGTTTAHLTPTATSLTGVASISAGSYHACAVMTAGGLDCWGLNAYGQLGDGTTTSQHSPVAPISSGVKQVSAGSYHTCVLKTDGTVWCTGYDSNGQLGNGVKVNSSTFVNVLGGAEQVSAGGYSTCAKLTSGGAACWGENTYGQLGQGTAGSDVLSPTALPTLGAVAEISVGFLHACARKYDGTVWCWGSNSNGQVGDGTTVDRSVPFPVAGITTATQIAIGGYHSCALLQDGTARCWGANSNGQLGDGTAKDSTSAVVVRNLSGAVQLAARVTHSCARLDSGQIQCWGSNSNGQIGDGTLGYRFVPTNVVW